MKVFSKVDYNTNASFPKRFLAYFVDTIIVGFIKLFALQLMFFNRSSKIFTDFFDNFSNVFPNLKVEDFKSIHVRYITSDPVYKEIFLVLLVLLTVTFLYKFLSYLFFKITLGQKLFGIKVIKNTDLDIDENISLMQSIFRSILEFLPSALIFSISFLIPFNILNFYRYTIDSSGIVGIFTTLIKYCTVDTLFLVVFIYVLFWFNIYFFSNRFFLHDILTRTRVIDKCKFNNENNESIEKKIVDKIGNGFSFLNKIRKYCFNLIENIINKVFKKCKRS